jgi:hypothetical protein
MGNSAYNQDEHYSRMNQPREIERENKAVKAIAGYVSLQV